MLKVYLVQMESIPGDKKQNLEHAKELVEHASPEPGSLIVFPEMFATGYEPSLAEQMAENFDSTPMEATGAFLTNLAEQTGCTVLGGGIHKSDGTFATRHFSNRTGFFTAKGEKAYYNKVHLFFPEQSSFAPGDDITLFVIKDFCISPTICYDLRFPELYRKATSKGANILTVQASWPTKRKLHWETLLKARAIENQAYVVAVNCVTRNGEYTGDSQIINPLGEVVAIAPAGKECVLSADLDFALLEQCRRDFCVLKDRRM